MKIEDAIQQKVFLNEKIKASINLQFTLGWINTGMRDVLPPYDISWQQYNILRILKGSDPNKMTTKDISSRMIDRMSNTSRLVEKLKTKGLVDQHRCPSDRRRVDISITDSGKKVAIDAGKELEKRIEELFSNLDEGECKLLNKLLDKIRINKKQEL